MKKSSIIAAVAVFGLVIGGANFASARMGSHNNGDDMGYNQGKYHTMNNGGAERHTGYNSMHNMSMEKANSFHGESKGNYSMHRGMKNDGKGKGYGHQGRNHNMNY